MPGVRRCVQPKRGPDDPSASPSPMIDRSQPGGGLRLAGAWLGKEGRPAFFKVGEETDAVCREGPGDETGPFRQHPASPVVGVEELYVVSLGRGDDQDISLQNSSDVLFLSGLGSPELPKSRGQGRRGEIERRAKESFRHYLYESSMMGLVDPRQKLRDDHAGYEEYCGRLVEVVQQLSSTLFLVDFVGLRIREPWKPSPQAAPDERLGIDGDVCAARFYQRRGGCTDRSVLTLSR